MTTPIAHDGQVVWYFAATVASVAAPTVSNITAATRILRITAYDTPSSEAEVDTSTVDDVYDTSVVGTAKAGPIVLTMQRLASGSELASWGAFTFRANGFLIKTLSGVAVATSKVAVYPVQVGQKRPEGYGRNATQNFQVSFYVTSAPNLEAVVAA